MTTATRNEAAERLHHALLDGTPDREGGILQTMLTEALAAERRATVQRIRAALTGRGFSPISEADMEWIGWRLDEEATR